MMIFISLVLILISVIYFWFKHKYAYFKNMNVPYVEPTIPFGNLVGVSKTIQFGMRFDEIYKKTKSDKIPISGIYIFQRASAIVTDLDLVKTVLVKDFDNFHSRNLYYNEKDDPLSAHLFNIEGKKWKDLRAKITPTFTSGKMKFMFPTITEVGEKFCDSINNAIKECNEIEIYDIFGRFTTDVIGACAFGIDCNSLNNPNAEFRLKGLKIFNSRLGLFGKLLTDAYPNLARKMGIKSEHDDVTEFFCRVLNETITYREKNNVRRNDFLEIMIELKNSLDESERVTFNEIAAQAYLFFAAGFETSSTTLSFCIYELVKNPDVQEKARKEIEMVLQNHKGVFSYDAMMEMKYLHQIIDETLRKYPPVPVVPRKVVNDYLIPNTDIILAKDSIVAIPIYSIHHDPVFYKDPETFDPDRFLPEEVQQRHSMAWLPFGQGPRNCVGLRFGKMQTYIGLFYLLKNFKFSKSLKTSEEIFFNPKSFLLSAQNGIWLKVEKL